jgi:hypothetical protein
MTDYNKHVLMNRTKPKIIQLYVELQDKTNKELSDKDEYIEKLQNELLRINKEHNIHTILQDEMATVELDLNKPPDALPIILETGNNTEEHYNQKLYETVNNENQKLKEEITKLKNIQNNDKNEMYKVSEDLQTENKEYFKMIEELQEEITKLKEHQKKYSINQSLDNTYQTWGDLLEMDSWDFTIEDVYNEVEKLVQLKLDKDTDNTNFERLVKKCETFKKKITELEFKNLKIKEYEERYLKEKEWRENSKIREHEQRLRADDLELKTLQLNMDICRLKKVVDKLVD